MLCNGAVGRTAQLGDDLGHIFAGAVKGDDHVQLVDAGQGHQSVAIVNALAFQQSLVGGIAVDHGNIGQQGSQLPAAV